MRPTTFVFLAIVCILIASVRGGFTSGSPHHGKSGSKSVSVKVPKGQENSNSQVLYSHWTKAFFGTDEDTARQLALNEGQHDLETWLRKRDLRWSPPLDFVEQHIRDQDVTPDKTLINKTPMTEVKLLIEITENEYPEILNHDRQARRENNQVFLARIVATIVTICAAVAGYLRLDEATKGYYTNLLRLGSLAVIGTVGAGVWLLA